MGIVYDKQSKVFLLNTATTTYAMGITDLGYLTHLHWGGRIGSPDDFRSVPDFLWIRLLRGSITHLTPVKK